MNHRPYLLLATLACASLVVLLQPAALRAARVVEGRVTWAWPR
jgi:hypothetical protein